MKDQRDTSYIVTSNSIRQKVFRQQGISLIEIQFKTLDKRCISITFKIILEKKNFQLQRKYTYFIPIEIYLLK